MNWPSAVEGKKNRLFGRILAVWGAGNGAKMSKREVTLLDEFRDPLNEAVHIEY